MQEKFIRICIDAINKYEPHDCQRGAEIISKAAEELPWHTHPMIISILHLAWDIAEDYQHEDEQLSDWARLQRIVSDYHHNNWYPTKWALSVVYSEILNDKIISGIGTRVTRKNSNLFIETSHDDIKQALETLATTLNQDQTDEWFIHNLNRALPSKIKDLVLTDRHVSEILVNN